MRRVGNMLCVLLWIVSVGCGYAPEPGVTLLTPSGGVFKSGDPVHLLVSEKIRVETLRVSVWAGPRNIEGAVDKTEPLLESCTVAASPCGSTSLEVVDGDDGEMIALQFDPEGLGKPDVPLIIEIEAGLESDEGAATGIPYYFDVQFLPAEGQGGPVTFQNGTYIFIATLKQPVKGLVFTLINDIVVMEDGRVALAGAEGDSIEGAAKNTEDPTEWEVDTSERGFTVHAEGQMTAVDGQRYLETRPIGITIDQGPLQMILSDVIISASVSTDPVTGAERMEGTLSYAELVLDAGTPHDYPADTVPFVGIYADPDATPAGTPQVCGDLCGAVTSQCEPPEAFPASDICAGQ